ncbi:HEAT repeat domain-containing protein [Gordonia sp. PKS22-38]|uniref:HEAT repeat domain-containing protein n=1 Tax=Gordonia prachuapensis TaxID=3115651 RepID=A0ABU7MY93_9ACTN|nr:HEAT repeat domain-containing protein [Gordonia sp. PKS22-38]
MTDNDHNRTLIDALGADDASQRLRAALAAGTAADERLVPVLIERCGTEPDFFVRDMLTWALCRASADITVPALLTELESAQPQARSQALHTLSKIGERRAFSRVAMSIHDPDDDVARAAWRAAVALVDPADASDLAADLAAEFGRGDAQVQLSLARAMVELGESAHPVVDAYVRHADPRVRAHAAATERLLGDPDAAFDLSVEMARRASVGVDV